jgi:hypothetical protein
MRKIATHRPKFNNQKDLFRQCVGLSMIRGKYNTDYANHLKTLSATALREEIRALRDSYAG